MVLLKLELVAQELLPPFPLQDSGSTALISLEVGFACHPLLLILLFPLLPCLELALTLWHSIDPLRLLTLVLVNGPVGSKWVELNSNPKLLASYHSWLRVPSSAIYIQHRPSSSFDSFIFSYGSLIVFLLFDFPFLGLRCFH